MSFEPENTASDRGSLWLAAIKPPMYSVAIMPIWLGSSIAFFSQGSFDVGRFLVFMISAICILAWTNISNDVFDSQTGIDRNKPHSLVNLTGNAEGVFWAGNLFLATGIFGILWLSWAQQDATVLGLVALCCLLGYAYQGPPFRLGYLGWGEPICFICFGPLAVEAAYYSQVGAWSGVGLAASILLGSTTTLILFCSHFHQVEDDLAAGKRSPVVQLGSKRSAQLIPWICGGTFGLLVLFVAIRILPIWTLLMLLSVPPAWELSNLLITNYAYPTRIQHAKFIAVTLHFCSGLLLGMGFILARLLA